MLKNKTINMGVVKKVATALGELKNQYREERSVSSI